MNSIGPIKFEDPYNQITDPNEKTLATLYRQTSDLNFLINQLDIQSDKLDPASTTHNLQAIKKRIDDLFQMHREYENHLIRRQKTNPESFSIREAMSKDTSITFLQKFEEILKGIEITADLIAYHLKQLSGMQNITAANGLAILSALKVSPQQNLSPFQKRFYSLQGYVNLQSPESKPKRETQTFFGRFANWLKNFFGSLFSTASPQPPTTGEKIKAPTDPLPTFEETQNSRKEGRTAKILLGNISTMSTMLNMLEQFAQSRVGINTESFMNLRSALTKLGYEIDMALIDKQFEKNESKFIKRTNLLQIELIKLIESTTNAKYKAGQRYLDYKNGFLIDKESLKAHQTSLSPFQRLYVQLDKDSKFLKSTALIGQTLQIPHPNKTDQSKSKKLGTSLRIIEIEVETEAPTSQKEASVVTSDAEKIRTHKSHRS